MLEKTIIACHDCIPFLCCGKEGRVHNAQPPHNAYFLTIPYYQRHPIKPFSALLWWNKKIVVTRPSLKGEEEKRCIGQFQ